MSRSSWRMGGGSMRFELDDQEGQQVGSRIRLSGAVLGICMWVDEAVTVRQPPLRKIWETVSEPRLLVIGRYRMGFEIIPDGSDTRSTVRVWIEYTLPEAGIARWLGAVFGAYYARWCVRTMAEDAASYFQKPTTRQQT